MQRLETCSRHCYGSRSSNSEEVPDETGVSMMEVYLTSRNSDPATAALHPHLWLG